MRSLTIGRADWYGWRLWIGVGPLTILLGRGRDDH
jgi:hypothetical protein